MKGAYVIPSPTVSPREAIKHLRNGARIREVHGLQRSGAVESFDLETGHIHAKVDLRVEPTVTSDRYTNPKYPLAGPAKIRILVRELIKGEWVIDPA